MLQYEHNDPSSTYKNNMDVLLYQNILLKQRNQILSKQNEKLLSKMEQLYKEENINMQKIKQCQNKIHLSSIHPSKQKQQLIKIIKLLSNKLPNQQITKIVNINQLINNNSITTLNLLSILSSIIQNYHLQSNSSISNIKRLQKLVQKRKCKIKEKTNNDRQIVHLVKQPTFIDTGIVQLDLEYVLMMGQKIATKVRRKQISLQRISSVFEEIGNYIAMRKQIKKDEKIVKTMERQIQLGVGCRRSFSELANRLLQKSGKQLIRKQQIQQLILKLQR